MSVADGLYRAAEICAELARESEARVTASPARANIDRRARVRAYRVAERRIVLEATEDEIRRQLSTTPNPQKSGI